MTSGVVVTRLAYREPFDAGALWAFLRARAVPGLEEFAGETYRRVLRLPKGPGVAELTVADGFVAARFVLADPADLPVARDRCRRLLDLDADPVDRSRRLAADPVLAPAAARYPGLRVPGSADPFETAVRAVLGQQVSLAAAATLAGRLVAAAGRAVVDHAGGLRAAFPDPAAVGAELDRHRLAMPASRHRAVAALAAAVAAGRLVLDGTADAVTVATLRALPGIGPWTADYIRLRALGDPDVFPAGDLGLRRQAATLGLPSAEPDLARHAARWSPNRSAVAQLLWTVHADPAGGTLAPGPRHRPVPVHRHRDRGGTG